MRSIASILLLTAFCCIYFDLTIAGSVNVNAEANAEANVDNGGIDDGEPEPGCLIACPQVVIEVCGRLRIAGQTIYKTFGNGCQLGVENCLHPNEQYQQVGGDYESCDDLQYYSKCRSACTREYNPVCGARYNSKGVRIYETFDNPCIFWSTVCLKPNLRWEKISDDEC